MIRQRIYLPAYDWTCIFYYDVTRKDAATVLDRLSGIGCRGTFHELASENLNGSCINTGLTFTNPAERISVSVISRTSSRKQFWNTLDHEKGHAVHHIADALGIDPDGEEYEYLAGDLAERTYPVAKQFLCESCAGQRKRTKNGESSQFWSQPSAMH